jgi:hypothetical protein
MDEDMMEAFVQLESLHNKPKLDRLHMENDGKRYTLKQNDECSLIYAYLP